jgi:hypothetical protein
MGNIQKTFYIQYNRKKSRKIKEEFNILNYMYIFSINVRIFKNQLYKLLHKYMQHYYYIHALVNFESSFLFLHFIFLYMHFHFRFLIKYGQFIQILR